jgi:hypothetical protein
MLSNLLATPTLVRIGGVPYLARPLRLAGFALLLSEGRVALGIDPSEDGLPAWNDARFADWLLSYGLFLLLWLTLRKDRPDFTLTEAESMAGSIDEPEAHAVLAVAMKRSSLGASSGGGSDISELRWGRTIKWLRETMSYAEIADLTLDQVTLEGTRPEMADPAIDAREHAIIEAMQRAWEAQHRPRTVEEDLAALGLEIVPEEEMTVGR